MKRKLKNAWAVALPTLLAILTTANWYGGHYYLAVTIGLLSAMHLVERYLKTELADQRLMTIGAAVVLGMARDNANNAGDDA